MIKLTIKDYHLAKVEVGEGADLCSINTVLMIINDQDAHDGDDHDEEDNERAKYNISRIIFTSLLGRWW